MLSKNILIIISTILILLIVRDGYNIYRSKKQIQLKLEYLGTQNTEESFYEWYGYITDNIVLLPRKEWNKYYKLNPTTYDFNNPESWKEIVQENEHELFLEDLNKLPNVNSENKDKLRLIKDKIIYKKV